MIGTSRCGFGIERTCGYLRYENRYDTAQYPRANSEYAGQNTQIAWVQVSSAIHKDKVFQLIARRQPVFVDTVQDAVDCARFLGHPLGGTGAARSVLVSRWHR